MKLTQIKEIIIIISVSFIAVLFFSSIFSSLLFPYLPFLKGLVLPSLFFPSSQEDYALCICENFTFYGMFHNRDDCRNFCESSNLLKHPQRFIDLKILEEEVIFNETEV